MNSSEATLLGTPQGSLESERLTRHLKENLRAYAQVMLVGEEVAASSYAGDAQAFEKASPRYVLRPLNIKGLLRGVGLCYELGLPISVRGAGTGYAGGATPFPEGVVILTHHLQQVTGYDPKKGIIEVEPGITIAGLNKLVKEDGWELNLPMRSADIATVGGSLASGSTAYLGSASLFSAAVIQTKVAGFTGNEEVCPKGLAMGSLGLLGPMTSIRLQLTKIPPCRYRALLKCSLQEAWDYQNQLREFKALQGALFIPETGLFLLIEGEEWQVKAVEKTLNGSFTKESPVPVPRPWHGFPLVASVPQKEVLGAYSALKDCLLKREIQAETWLDILQGRLISYLSLEKDIRPLKSFLLDWVNTLEKWGGYFPANHGHGRILKEFLPSQLSPSEIDEMQKLKREWDPSGLFSKGVTFPEEAWQLQRERAKK